MENFVKNNGTRKSDPHKKKLFIRTIRRNKK